MTYTAYTADLYINDRSAATFRDRGLCWMFVSAYLYGNRQDKVVLKDDRGERVYFWDGPNGRVDIEEIRHS